MACLTQRDCGEDKGKYDRSKDEEGDKMPPVAVRLAMLSTELLLLPLMPPPLLPPLMPPQVRATRALARLRGGSTDHGSSARPAIYPCWSSLERRPCSS